MVQTLVKNSKYAGQYVALKSFKDNTVVSNEKTLSAAHRKALKAGYTDPVVIYVPQKDAVLIY
ncbi:hypothetical protein MNBD_UNCLBAC01-1215 [hydrothermal vent metagenome]|uniref:DUF5678 domain-containing protein n=1 Tax=hydrothermal vent metagenome TaxID=652676 RepID=A0A3B1D2H8_9ZZZZ